MSEDFNPKFKHGDIVEFVTGSRKLFCLAPLKEMVPIASPGKGPRVYHGYLCVYWDEQTNQITSVKIPEVMLRLVEEGKSQE